jgi:D-amino-acid dehydrogenase
MSQVVIIGVGVIGLSCGHTLCKAGADVVLLDKGEPGLGWSSSSGMRTRCITWWRIWRI